MSTVVEQIKERLDIVEILGSYLKLEKAGLNYKARCPFHNEKTPSFFVSPQRQTFYCFGCEAHGDIFSFLERFEGLDFKGALKSLADRAGVKLGDFKPEIEEKKERIYRIMEKSTVFFEKNLEKNPEALEYLEKRGISKDSINKWRIGFIPDLWREVHDLLVAEKFSRAEILEAGMVKKVEGEEKYYDTFRDRIMFPIFDRAGRVIAFSGRILTETSNAPKYLNSPETPVFRKSEVLYGLHLAKEAIRKSDYAVLVEGQMDLVLSHQAGVNNTVASSGTALTDLHLKLLQKISNRVIVAYDADSAGLRAAKRSAELGLTLAMEVKIASLPEGEDPASIVNKSEETWKEVLKKSVDAITFSLQEVEKLKLSQIALGKKVNQTVLPLISLIENDIIRSQYISLVSQKTGILLDAITSEVKKLRVKSPVETKLESVIEPLSLTPEEILVGLIISDPSGNEELKKKFENIVGPELLSQIRDNGQLDKEVLIFETERILSSLDLEKTAEELLERVERKMLKKRFEELARNLDSGLEDKEKIKEEMGEINQKLSKFT